MMVCIFNGRNEFSFSFDFQSANWLPKSSPQRQGSAFLPLLAWNVRFINILNGLERVDISSASHSRFHLLLNLGLSLIVFFVSSFEEEINWLCYYYCLNFIYPKSIIL